MNESSDPRDLLEDYKVLWQEEPTPHIVPTMDIHAMAKKAVWLGWRMRLVFVFEVCTLLLAIYLSIQILLGDRIEELKTFAWFGLATSIIGLPGIVLTRQGAWQNPDKDTMNILKTEVARTQSAIRYLIFNGWFCLPCIPLLILGARVTLARSEQDASTSPLFAFSIYAALLIGMFVYWAILPRLLRNKRQRLETLNQMIENISES